MKERANFHLKVDERSKKIIEKLKKKQETIKLVETPQYKLENEIGRKLTIRSFKKNEAVKLY